MDLFPSPYGVLFILILGGFKMKNLEKKVSVSLRSIIHSYINGLGGINYIIWLVSVSLRSIIHSYKLEKSLKRTLKKE